MNAHRSMRTPLALVLAASTTGLLANSASAEPPRYAVTIIGGFAEPGSTTRPYAINTLGHVTGSGFADGGSAAFLYGRDLQRLPGLPGSPLAVATSLNDSGVAVGYAFSHVTDPFPVRAVMWSGGVATDLGTLGGPEAYAAAINNHGGIVGLSSAVSGGDRRPFVWQSGSMSPLAMPAGFDQAVAHDINDSNLILGWGDAGAPHTTRPILWLDGVPRMLPVLSEDANTFALKMNDAGHAIGIYQSDAATGSVLWRDGHIVELGGFGGPFPYVTVADINNRDQIVGYSSEHYDHAPFLWQDGVMYRLEDYLDPAFASIELITAEAINDRGQIAGTALIDGLQTGVLLTPIPAPPALVLVAVAASSIAYRRRASR